MTAGLREVWETPATPPASAADIAAVEACVRDYAESWFEGDADRMAGALHPQLVKRAFGQGPDHAPVLDETSCDEMIEGARHGFGIPRRGDRLQIHVCA